MGHKAKLQIHTSQKSRCAERENRLETRATPHNITSINSTLFNPQLLSISEYNSTLRFICGHRSAQGVRASLMRAMLVCVCVCCGARSRVHARSLLFLHRGGGWNTYSPLMRAWSTEGDLNINRAQISLLLHLLLCLCKLACWPAPEIISCFCGETLKQTTRESIKRLWNQIKIIHYTHFLSNLYAIYFGNYGASEIVF
jgi:hypothetical protein